MEVGDRVVAIEDIGKNLLGLVGTILRVHGDSTGRSIMVTVEFDVNMYGHDGRAVGVIRGKNKHCWNMSITSVELLGEKETEPPRIRWYKNGKLS